MKEFKNLFISLNYNIKKYDLNIFNNISDWNETKKFINEIIQLLEKELNNKQYTQQQKKGLLNCYNLINTLQRGKYDN